MESVKKYYLSDAIDSFGTNYRTWFIFTMIFFITIFQNFSNTIVSFTMPNISTDLGMTNVQLGSLTTYQMVGMLIGTFLSGFFADRFGRKPVILAMITIFSLGTAAIYWCNSYPVFCILRFITGIGMGPVVAMACVIMGEFAPTNRRGFFIVLNSIGAVLGGAITGFFVGMVVPTFGWRLSYIVGAIPLLYGLFLLFKLPESMHWNLVRGRKDKALADLLKFEKAGTGKISGQYTVEGMMMAPHPPEVSWKAVFKDHPVITFKLALGQFCANFVVYGTITWLPMILVLKGFDIKSASYYTAAGYLAGTVMVILSAILSEYLGRRKNCVLGYSMLALSCLLLVFANSYSMIFISCIAIGALRSYAGATLSPINTEAYPTEYRSTGVGVCMSIGRFGGMTAPLLMGAIISTSLGVSGGVGVCIVPCLLIIAIVLTLKSEGKGKSIDKLNEEFACAANKSA